MYLKCYKLTIFKLKLNTSVQKKGSRAATKHITRGGQNKYAKNLPVSKFKLNSQQLNNS